jgi:hypothetical protein
MNVEYVARESLAARSTMAGAGRSRRSRQVCMVCMGKSFNTISGPVKALTGPAGRFGFSEESSGRASTRVSRRED